MLSDAAKYELLVLSSREMDTAMTMVNSMSGAVRADSPIHIAASHAYRKMAEGMPFAEAITKEDISFRQYALENHRKIEAAPKLKRGGYAGQSSLHYKWVAEDGFERYALPHMKFMAERAFALDGLSPVPLPGFITGIREPARVDASEGMPNMGAKPTPKESEPIINSREFDAISMNRHRASAKEKRMYGGSTVTTFSICRKSNPGKRVDVDGYGATPGERKTDAIRRAAKSGMI